MYKNIQDSCADVCDVLKNLIKNYRLGIFSEGSSKFQNNKFHSLGLDNYFDPELIFIRSAKDTQEVVNEIPKGAIIVDDKESICDFLYKNEVKCVWLNRKDMCVSNKYPTIHNLLELPNLLLK